MDDKSQFYPDEFGWWQIEEGCPDCKQPLHIASGQEVAFCPNCAIDKKNAYNGRVMLALIKAKDLRERLDAEERRRNSRQEDQPQGPLAFGMPL